MKKQVTLLASTTVLCLLVSFAKAQTYTIESFEGHQVKLNLCDTFLHGRTLKLFYLKDTVETDCWGGLEKVSIVNKRFLQIVCGVRGGSGLALKNTLLLSVKGGKIHVCMAVLSYAKGVGAGWEALYKVKLSIAGRDKNNYKVIAALYDEKIYGDHKADHKKASQVILSFDVNQNIFYTTYKHITNKFFDNTENINLKPKKQMISGTFPAVILSKSPYYFIKGRWYSESGLKDILYAI